MMIDPMLTADSSVMLTKDGRVVAIRPIWPSDAPAMEEMLLRSSPNTRYRRFHAPMPRIPGGLIRQLTRPDAPTRGGIAAIASGMMIGAAHYGETPDGTLEVAVIVEDGWQGRGVGRALLDRIFQIASEQGYPMITGTVLRDNEPMVHLLEQIPSAWQTFDGPYRTFWFEAKTRTAPGHAA